MKAKSVTGYKSVTFDFNIDVESGGKTYKVKLKIVNNELTHSSVKFLGHELNSEGNEGELKSEILEFALIQVRSNKYEYLD